MNNSWQPIETAPRDGSTIDVWEFCHDPEWRPDSYGIENGMRYTDAAWKDGAWKKYDDESADWVELGNEHYTVSHWMPIPERPSSDQQ